MYLMLQAKSQWKVFEKIRYFYPVGGLIVKNLFRHYGHAIKEKEAAEFNLKKKRKTGPKRREKEFDFGHCYTSVLKGEPLTSIEGSQGIQMKDG